MKPMLAATVEDINSLAYPLLASPKLDGIRALVVNGKLVSRNLKPIPNKFINKNLPLKFMDGWDGELIVGKSTDKDCFRKTTSGVMSEDGEPDFKFFVFDYIPKGDIRFIDRYQGLKYNMGWANRQPNRDRLMLVPHYGVRSPEELIAFEQRMLKKGYEGVMLRSFNGGYKFGRSTLKEGALMKLKRFEDSEATIIGFEERMHNGNEAKKDELGRTKRSSHKSNKQGTNTLGAVNVRDNNTGVVFDIGTGFDDELRQLIWDNRKHYMGQSVKYKFFPSGSKDKPRFPVFLGFRKD